MEKRLRRKLTPWIAIGSCVLRMTQANKIAYIKRPRRHVYSNLHRP